jgi:putative hydrolase of the HAD superfamily
VVVTLDFWNTLYRNNRTAQWRTAARNNHLLEKATALRLPDADALARSFFHTVDDFIEEQWRAGANVTDQQALAKAVECYGGRFSESQLEGLLSELHRLYTTVLKPVPYPGAVEFVEWAASRWPLCLISDTYTIRGRTIDEILSIDRLKDAFRVRCYSDELGVQKPSPAALHHVATAFRVLPEEIVHIGDLLDRDYEMAARFGARFIWLTHKTEEAHVPEAPRSFPRCRSFSELTALLDREPYSGDVPRPSKNRSAPPNGSVPTL